jgi:hypothetical protein
VKQRKRYSISDSINAGLRLSRSSVSGRQNYQATVDGKADAFTKEAPHVAADGSRFGADDGKSGYAPSGYSILSNRKAAGP